MIQTWVKKRTLLLLRTAMLGVDSYINMLHTCSSPMLLAIQLYINSAQFLCHALQLPQRPNMLRTNLNG